MFKLPKLAGVVACATLGFSALVHADAVTDWNAITMDAVTAARPGPQGMLDVALVHIAVHDAVQAIEKRYEPYHFEMANAKGSRSAATAAAAHGVLVAIYPAQASTLDTAYYNYLAQRGLNGDPGLVVGEKAATSIVPLRRATPNPAPPPFVGSMEIGVWRPTDSFIGAPPAPAPFSPMVTPWLAETTPFTLTSPRRFRVGPPPALTSERYTRDYAEVKAIGAFNSTVRTAEQTDLAYFYNDNFFAQWNRALRGVAQQRVQKIGDSARLFALANMAGADALITCWDSKRAYVFWRPLTAIREGANDGNEFTVADPTWQPLVNTPNYPDYTSGANSLVAAMTRTLEMFFGSDRGPLEVTSLHPLAVKKTRSYARFSDAADDVVEARIYLGIHFRFADVAARRQGTKVAEHAFDHFLLPLDRWNRWEH
ncbi:MAG TPA: vanadium-dependent haloperoxidase [Steroidobacteraceae bacterium]|jgi:hypothetical protein|nr:vanadium-dependent haloperoxidase [Steroidobacteraceae bacterium]